MISEVDMAENPFVYYRRYAREFFGSRVSGARPVGGRCRFGDRTVGHGDEVQAVRACHDARLNRLTSLADQLLECYAAGRSGQAAKEHLVHFVTGEVITQIVAENDAFRPIARSVGKAAVVDALPAGPDLIRSLIREIAGNNADTDIAAATGALVLLLDARATAEKALLLPALAQSPERRTSLTALLKCCGLVADTHENRSEWWIG